MIDFKKLSLSIIFAIWILTGCSDIVYNGNPIDIQAPTVYQKNTNFASLFLTQKVIQLSKNEFAVYEKAQTNNEYEFEPSIYRIIQIVFETKSFIPVYSKNHIYAYQLVMPNHKLLNLIAYQFDTQELTFIYGMSNKEFKKMLLKIDDSYQYKLYTNIIQVDKTHKFITKWNDWKVHFVPLVVPLARLMSPF
jgi:hypothetical protein